LLLESSFSRSNSKAWIVQTASAQFGKTAAELDAMLPSILDQPL
jgi:hypothetical protein